jgi:hypothetical protein
MLNYYVVILTIIILYILDLFNKSNNQIQDKILEGFSETTGIDSTAIQNLASLYSSGEATIMPKLKATSILTSGDIDIGGTIRVGNQNLLEKINSLSTTNGSNLLTTDNTFTGTNTFNNLLVGTTNVGNTISTLNSKTAGINTNSTVDNTNFIGNVSIGNSTNGILNIGAAQFRFNNGELILQIGTTQYKWKQ